jgi:hypothetical protein
MSPRAPWVMPAWMEKYRAIIVNTGGNPIEELMNDHDTIVQVNAPRAIICVAVKSQVALLYALNQQGILP